MRQRNTEKGMQMENNKTTTGFKKGNVAGRQTFLSIYHIPSVFFNELVERERGLRMILMVRPFIPNPLRSRYVQPETKKKNPSGVTSTVTCLKSWLVSGNPAGASFSLPSQLEGSADLVWLNLCVSAEATPPLLLEL